MTAMPLIRSKPAVVKRTTNSFYSQQLAYLLLSHGPLGRTPFGFINRLIAISDVYVNLLDFLM